MHITNSEKYKRYHSNADFSLLSAEFWLHVLLFGSIGAITWAIRGTNGWGGIDGTILPGMAWAMLWYYCCKRKGVSVGGLPLWLGLGIAIGGEWGYGQYVSWIRGMFQVAEGTININPTLGWTWFFICGIAWGAPGAVALGWALSLSHSWRNKESGILPVWMIRWSLRLIIPIAFGYLGYYLIQWRPQYFFPHYDTGIYNVIPLDDNQDRTIFTNTQNFVVVMWFLGAFLVALAQRDKATLISCIVIGFGFGFGFALSAIWCMGYEYAPAYIDWWKMWELQAGFNLGFLYVVILYWALKHAPEKSTQATPPTWDCIAILLTTFLFWGTALWGVSVTAAGLLELINADTNQYAWPTPRKWIFAITMIPLLLLMLREILRLRSGWQSTHTLRTQRMSMLIVGTTAIGAISIWPTEIGVLYALLCCTALYALNTLNAHWDREVR